jgi:hypothetical protein
LGSSIFPRCIDGGRVVTGCSAAELLSVTDR